METKEYEDGTLPQHVANFKCDTPPQTIKFTAGTTNTVSSWSVDGTLGNLITIGSVTAATHAIVKAGGGTISSNYLSISYSVVTPSSTWTAYSSTDAGNNTGWTFGSLDPVPFPAFLLQIV